MPLISLPRRKPQPKPQRLIPADSPFLPRTVLDTIGPHDADLPRDGSAVVLENLPAAGLAVTTLPRSVVPGWLRNVAAGIPFDLAIFVRPIPADAAQRFLDRQVTVHGSAQRFGASRGRISDTLQDTALEDAASLRMPIQRGQEQLFRISLYGLLRATTRPSLNGLVRQTREAFARIGLHTRETRFQHLQAFRSCLPQLTDELEEEHYLHTSGLAAMLPWSAVRLWMPGGFLWGLAKETRTPIGINLFANPPLTDANLTVFARVRQGKSFLLKLIARRFLATHGAGLPVEGNRGGRCVVVDAEAKQEYRPLCENVGGQYIRLGPGSPVRINPFDLPPFDPTDDDLRDPLRDHIVSVERLLELLLAERSRRLTAEEIAILDLALEATYAGEWRDAPSGPVRGGYTHDPQSHRPERAPLMRDLLTVLRGADQYLPAVNSDVVQSLATRLARYVEGSLADFFREPTNVALDARFTAFNVSALGEELWPIGLHLIEQFVWTQVRWHYVQGDEEPCLLLVDELWLTLRSAEGGAFLETVARKGPKYWLGLAVASQEPADCLNSPHGLAIVHNSSTHVLLALDKGAVRPATEAFDLTPTEVALLERAVPGEALVICAGERVFLDIVASPAEKQLFDTRPAEQAAENRRRRRGSF
ncbi:MAG: hypothetical protein JO352_13230, partial [Chloroflexi bacterium]|nr:hypothetical protein [Chloroflexota bacterium]